MKKRTTEQLHFRLIESELFNYKETKREFERMQSDIIEGTAHSDVTVQAGIGNPTEAKATKLLTSLEYIVLGNRIRAIEESLGIIKSCGEPNKYRLIEMKYFNRRYTDMGIWEELNIGKTTFYKWRGEVIHLIAGKLGYKV